MGKGRKASLDYCVCFIDVSMAGVYSSYRYKRETRRAWKGCVKTKTLTIVTVGAAEQPYHNLLVHVPMQKKKLLI